MRLRSCWSFGARASPAVALAKAGSCRTSRDVIGAAQHAGGEHASQMAPIRRRRMCVGARLKPGRSVVDGALYGVAIEAGADQLGRELGKGERRGPGTADAE